MENSQTEIKTENRFERKPSKGEYKFLFGVSLVVLVTACLIILFYFGVKRYDGLQDGWVKFMDILQPFIIGFTMAFLMNPIMKFIEKHLLHFLLPISKNEVYARKHIRVFSTIVSAVVLLGVVGGFLVTVIPEMLNTIQYLFLHIHEQIAGVLDWANEITRGHWEEEILGAKDAKVLDNAMDQVQAFVTKYLKLDQRDEIIRTITNSVIGVGHILVNILIGIIVSIYVLVSKEKFKGQTKKIVYSVLSTKQANVCVEVVRKAHDIFYGFIVGKIVDSIIIGLICYVCMIIMGLPYRVLVSVIIGLTNVIPVFGPYIGAVPTVIIIFLTNPWQGIYFLIFVFILQQVDGNIIGPKILGDSTGLSSFWVIVAIVVGGGLFGLLGMLIGVPTMALLYYLVGRIVDYVLSRKQLSTEMQEYVDLDHIDPETKQLVPKDGEKELRIFNKHKETVKTEKVAAKDKGDKK